MSFCACDDFMAGGRTGAGWPAAVVFDLDGTLVDSAPDIARALNGVLAGIGVSGFSRDQVAAMVGGGAAKLIERALGRREARLGASDVDDLVARFLDDYARNATAETRLYDGVEELLRYLTRRSVWVGLCTNKPVEIARRILADLGVLGYFDAVIGGEMGFAKKPDPEPLVATLGQLADEPGQAVFVGDSAADVGAARALGLPVVLMSYGYSAVPQRDLGGDRVCDRLMDVPAALESLAPRA